MNLQHSKPQTSLTLLDSAAQMECERTHITIRFFIKHLSHPARFWINMCFDVSHENVTYLFVDGDTEKRSLFLQY